MRRTGIALVTGAVAALLAACAGPAAGPSSKASSSSAEPPATVPAVPGIEAEIVRLRTDEAIGGQVQVRLTDTGDTPFTVTAVAIESAGFTPLPRTKVTAEFEHGAIIDLPTPYGRPVCHAAAEPAAARLTVVRPGGAVEQVRVPLAAEILGRIHREECAVRGVLDVVGIELTGLRLDKDSVRGAISLTRHRGSDRVAVTRLEGSVLLDATAAGLPRTMAGSAPGASIPVAFAMASCAPHVLAETKQPYLFPLAVTVGTGSEVSVHLPVDAATKALFVRLVHRVCRPA